MKNKISVAILDTGVYRHVDFDNRIIGFYDTVKKGLSLMMTADMERMYAELLQEVGGLLTENLRE